MTAPAGTVTHALVWVPRQLGDASWDLLTRADYEVSEGGYSWPDELMCRAPRDTDPDALAEWVARKLGGLVVLTPATDKIRYSRFGPWHNRLLYWVSRVTIAEA